MATRPKSNFVFKRPHSQRWTNNNLILFFERKICTVSLRRVISPDLPITLYGRGADMHREYTINAALPLILLPVITGCSGGGGGGNSYSPPTGSVELEWSPPPTYTDGSNLSPADIGGYKIYYGTIPGLYIDHRDVGNTTSIQISSLNLPTKQTYYAAVTVYDSDGYESPFSNEVSIAANLIPPIDDWPGLAWHFPR
jgi:hypothetical protein